MNREYPIENYGVHYRFLPLYLLAFIVFLLSLLAAYFDILFFYVIISGSIFIFFFLYKIYKIKQVVDWKRTSATIKNYKIIEYDRYDKSDGMSVPDFQVYVTYEYSINGNSYESDTISNDSSMGYFENDLGGAKIYLSSFLKQDILEAFVNPYKPNEAILDNKISNISIYKLKIYIFFIFLIILGIFYLQY